MKLLSIKNLYYLHCGPINLQVNASECIGVCGVSGSGKSLFLRALSDLDDHQGGISLDDVNQQEIKAHLWRRKVALLSAETQWWFDTVGEHFTELTEQSLFSLGLDFEIANWAVSRLSSGEKQRLGLLRLLENSPEVLLLDEPTANLDKKNTLLFENFVREYLLNNSSCAIWVSHDAQQLQRVCRQQYEIKSGELILC